MKKIDDRDFTTYPRRFLAYRWYKPLLLAAFFVKDRPLSSYFSSYCSSHSFSMRTRNFTGSMRSGTTILNLLMQSTPEREKLPESDLTNMNGDTIR